MKRKCKKHNWQEKMFSFVMEVRNLIFVFKDVPVKKCKTCGETLIPEEIIKTCLDFVDLYSLLYPSRIYHRINFSQTVETIKNMTKKRETKPKLVS